MAEISSGNEDKSVGKSSSFKLFGRSPSGTPERSSSKKKSNRIGRLFSRKNSEIEKQNVANYEGDSSSNNDGDTRKRDKAEASSLPQKTEINVQKVTQVASHGIQTFVKEMTNANTIPESKESIPAIDEKKPDIVTKVKEVAENSKEEILEKGKEGLKEVFKALTAVATTTTTNELPEEEKLEKGKEQTSHGKEGKPSNYNNDVDDHDADQKKTTPSQEKCTSLNTADAATTVNTGAPNQKLQEEEKEEAVGVGVVFGAMQQEETSHGEIQENGNKQEDNCVASLAEGLQKICAPAWNKDNKDD